MRIWSGVRRLVIIPVLVFLWTLVLSCKFLNLLISSLNRRLVLITVPRRLMIWPMVTRGISRTLLKLLKHSGIKHRLSRLRKNSRIMIWLIIIMILLRFALYNLVKLKLRTTKLVYELAWNRPLMRRVTMSRLTALHRKLLRPVY